MTLDLSQTSWRKSSFSGGNGGECVEMGYAWRKSSFSGGNGGACVEVAAVGAVRDSKNPGGAVLVTTHLGDLVRAVKDGHITRP
jgi:hypothetical protein